MWFLLNIIYYSISNLFLGVILTILGVALLYFLIGSWYRNCQFSLVSFIVGAILFLFLSFQSILLCGAVTIKSYTDDVEVAINNMVSRMPDSLTLNQEDSQAILDNVVQEWPLVGQFVDLADFRGHTPVSIAHAMCAELHSVMNYYILRRVLWSLLFIIVSAIVVIRTMEKSFSRSSSRYYGPGGGRRYRY